MGMNFTWQNSVKANFLLGLHLPVFRPQNVGRAPRVLFPVLQLQSVKPDGGYIGSLSTGGGPEGTASSFAYTQVPPLLHRKLALGVIPSPPISHLYFIT